MASRVVKPKKLLPAADFRRRFQYCRAVIRESTSFKNVVETLSDRNHPHYLMPTSKADLEDSFRVHEPFLRRVVYPLSANTHPNILPSNYVNFNEDDDNFTFITAEALTESCLKICPVSLVNIYARIAASDLRVNTRQFADGSYRGLIMMYPRYLARDFPCMAFDAALASENVSIGAAQNVGFGVSFRTPVGRVIDNIYGKLYFHRPGVIVPSSGHGSVPGVITPYDYCGGIVSSLGGLFGDNGSLGNLSSGSGDAGGLGGPPLHPLHSKDFSLHELGALIEGLEYNQKNTRFRMLAIFGDCEDVISVLEGYYSIPEYGFERYIKACEALRMLVAYSLHHVYREQNLLADSLAGCGLKMRYDEISHLKDANVNWMSWREDESKHVQEKLGLIMGYDMEPHPIIRLPATRVPSPKY